MSDPLGRYLCAVATITDKVVWETVFVTKTVWDDDLPTSTAAAFSSAAELVAGAISTTSAAPTTVASGTKSKTANSASVTNKSGLLPDGIIAKAAALGLTLSAGINLSTAQRSPTTTSTPPATTTVSGPKKVFAHFMVGIVSTYENADWVADMQLAKEKGIDGFALNIGVDPYTQQQLDLAYAAGASVGNFDLFISFDFNWYKLPNTGGVADMLKRYKDSPAQYRVDGKPFVSTFIGDGFDFVQVAQQVGEPIYAVPCWQPSAENVNNAGVSGLFSWYVYFCLVIYADYLKGRHGLGNLIMFLLMPKKTPPRTLRISSTLRLQVRLTWHLSLLGLAPTLGRKSRIRRIGFSRARLCGRLGGNRSWNLVAD